MGTRSQPPSGVPPPILIMLSALSYVSVPGGAWAQWIAKRQQHRCDRDASTTALVIPSYRGMLTADDTRPDDDVDRADDESRFVMHVIVADRAQAGAVCDREQRETEALHPSLTAQILPVYSVCVYGRESRVQRRCEIQTRPIARIRAEDNDSCIAGV